MSSQTLAEQVRAYLDLQSRLEAYGTAGVHVGRAARELELDMAGKDILNRLDAPQDGSNDQLIKAVRSYFDRRDEFARCSSRGSGLDAAARRMERARRDLEEQLQEFNTPTHDTLQPPAAAPHRPLRILIAVDKSEPALWAFEVGAEIARRTSAKVLLLHVLPPPTSRVGEFVVVMEDLDTKRHNEADALLGKLRAMLPPSVQSRRMVRVGIPADEIIDAARSGEADLIVIGTHGRGRLARFFLGSTAQDVIRGATCPVLTVAQPAHWATPQEQFARPVELAPVPA